MFWTGSYLEGTVKNQFPYTVVHSSIAPSTISMFSNFAFRCNFLNDAPDLQSILLVGKYCY